MTIVPLDFENLISFENLYKAHKVARCSKRHKFAVINFENNLFENLHNLSSQLKNGTYKVSKYKSFYIYEPKKREIQALGYKDRIVQHALCDNFLIPFYEKRLIYANCACRKNKGSYFARQLLKKYLVDFYKKNKSNGYVLKCDIKKYFANIDHNILKNQLQKIKDKNIYNLICTIIDSFNFDTKLGLPIGNQVSQILGVSYLDSIDRLIKEKLKIKYYIRYMDDLVLIHNSQNYLKYCLNIIKQNLLKLNVCFNKKTEIFPLSEGLEFLGGRYKFLKTGKVLITVKKQSKQRYNKNIKCVNYYILKKSLDCNFFKSCIGGYKGHFKGFNANNLLKKFKQKTH